MKLLDLDAIEARADNATSAPWSVCDEWEQLAPGRYIVGGTGGIVFAPGVTGDGTADVELSEGDAAFIAAAREDVPDLVARVRRLQALVAVLVTHERDNSHSHACVGTWDRSNGAPLGGAPCARCHTFADAREAIGLPRWPTRDEYHQRAEDRPPTCEHPAGCGCGAELYTHTTAHTAPRRSP